ncbi:MAG: LptF/LptG family permease, partial [Pseudomonadales bacterium]
MILFRYFAREIFTTMLAVAGVVLVISMGWRFSGYLSEAASGLITRDVLFLVMAYRLPGFLELIIPISFFLAIMLAYGRLYADSEM